MTTPSGLTDSYRDRLLQQRVTASQTVTAGLRDVDLDLAPDRLRAEIARWAGSAAALTEAAQVAAGRLSLGYLTAYLVVAGAGPGMPTVDPLARVGTVPPSVPGATLPEAMRRAGYGVLWRLRSAPRDVAVRYGSYAATRVTWTALQASATGVLHDVIRDHPRVDRWRRITSASACSFCRAARGGTAADPLDDLHPSCRCTQEPVVTS